MIKYFNFLMLHSSVLVEPAIKETRFIFYIDPRQFGSRRMVKYGFTTDVRSNNVLTIFQIYQYTDAGSMLL